MPSKMKLPQEAFMKLNWEQIYDLDKQVYEKLERKEKFIEDLTLLLSTKNYPASGVTTQALVAPRKSQ